MSKVIICGAGPIGLYLSIRLKQMGVTNILIIDPRAGEYTRPGHLNSSVFQTAEKGLNIKIWPQEKTGHIKDLERKLYQEALKLGIQIEQKKFVGFINLPEKKGIIASDMDGQLTEIECYLAFDCTGSQRELIHAINQALNEVSFTLKSIIDSNDLPVKKHFLGFVKMSNIHHSSLIDSYYFNLNSNPIKYVKYMEKFFKMGWKEFAPPHCYTQNFGKGKICIYTEHPDNLSSDLHAPWLQLVLEFYSDDPTITYELCSPPKRGRKNLDLMNSLSFLMNYHHYPFLVQLSFLLSWHTAMLKLIFIIV